MRNNHRYLSYKTANETLFIVSKDRSLIASTCLQQVRRRENFRLMWAMRGQNV